MSTQHQNVTVVARGIEKVVLENRPIPQPKQGQLLIKTRRTLISTGTELTVLSGEFPPNSIWSCIASHLPYPLGYSNIGKVVDIGKGVEEQWIGRRVGTYEGGYHAQYVIGTLEKCCLVPKNISDDQATFFVLARTAMNGVRCGKVQWGEAAAVYGLGILGQLTVRFCHIAGARPVVGTDISKPRLKYLPDLPGIMGINPNDQEFMNRIKKLTRNRLFDVVFEVTGNPDVIPQEFRILKTQGRFVVLSSPRGKTLFDFHDLCNWPSYSIIGAHTGSHPQMATADNPWTKKRHAELFFNLVANGELDVESLISHRESYEKAPELYKMLLEDRSQALGVVLEW